MNKFTLTRKMIDALGTTIDFDGGSQCMIMSAPATQRALYRRGLANESGFLTLEGEYLAFLYRVAPGSRKTWTRETVRIGASAWRNRNQRSA